MEGFEVSVQSVIIAGPPLETIDFPLPELTECISRIDNQRRIPNNSGVIETTVVGDDH